MRRPTKDTAAKDTPRSSSHVSSCHPFLALGSSQNDSGGDVQYDLAALMRRAAKHLVGNASVFQREHSPYIGDELCAFEELRDPVQPRGRHIHVEVRCSNAMTCLCCLRNR